MKRLRATTLLLGCLALTVFGTSACDDPEPAESEASAPAVGPLELPISLRYDTTAPASAVKIEISTGELRLEGQPVLALENGRVPDGERADSSLPKLAEALRSGPARRVAQLRIHGNVPYLTTALVLGTLKAANIHQASFEVRQGTGTNIGHLTLDRFDVRQETDDEWATFPASHQRSWEELAPHWEAMTAACRENHSVDCDYKPANIAEGGQMQITLFARGNAVKVELDRFGVEQPQPDTAAGPALIEGIAPEPDATEDESPPATRAAFTWRFQATTSEPSPVALTLREICGAQACGAVVTAEGQTMTMRILSLIGAAFPNGSPAPQILFQIPPR